MSSVTILKMAIENVIAIKNLSKRYGSNQRYALYNLNLSVNKGEIYGFIGPNGAGKSTTIRTLLNFIQPTSGTASIFGHDIVKDSLLIRKSIGYLSGDFIAYPKLTGQEFINYLSSLQPLKHKSAPASLCKIFKFDSKKKIRDLSKGNRQKLGIIQAFMHEPELLILDEPTDGLDPLMQEVFYDLLSNFQTRGTTVFLSSHNLAEVQKVCNRVAVIRDGQLVTEANISDLLNNSSQTFEVRFKNDILMSALRAVRGVENVKKVGIKTFSFNVRGNLSPALSFMSKQQTVHIVTKELNLEDKFLKLYKGNK